MELKPKTPIKINAAVKFLVKNLGLNTIPIYLPLSEFESARTGYCFNNCEDYIQVNGGIVIYGWMIWEDRKKSFIEAEFHAVVKVNGKLLDITPRQSDNKEILFVEDNIRESGRHSDDTWFSYDNIKVFENNIVNEPKPILIREIDNYDSEIIFR